MDITRRRFLSLRTRPSGAATETSARPAPFRPPWAVAEADFAARCTRCGDCVQACPTGLLTRDESGYPLADFFPGHAPAGCTFCGDCASACPSQALRRQADAAPWHLSLSIGEDCLARQNIVCRTCGERCEAGALTFLPRLGGVALPRLDAARCTGCAACLADCPTLALRIVRPLDHCSHPGVSA